MTWEDKTEMIQFFNNGQDESALDVLLKNIDNIDEQGWDMFITGITLDKDKIKENIDKHKIIVEYIRKQKSDSFRTSLRFVYYKDMVDDI